MKSKFTRALAILALALTPVAQASLEPRWSEVDANHDGKPDTVAITNLADIAFNEKGEIVGWFFKVVKGEDISKPRAGGFNLFGFSFGGGGGSPVPYNGLPSLVGGPSVLIVLPEAANKTPIVTQKPLTSVTPDLMEATFKYKQGNAQIEKKFSFNPRRLTLNLEVKTNGIDNPKLEFVGFDQANPQKKLLEQGSQKPLDGGSVKALGYAALLGDWAHAMIVQPEDDAKYAAQLTSRRDTKTNPDGTKLEVDHGIITVDLPANSSHKLRIYAGPNELVRLNLEGYHPQLPEVFSPNIFGQLSLGLMKILQTINQFIPSWGLTIIVFTILLRLALWPLLQTQLRSTAQMQALQPKINELKEKFKDDPAKLNAETMKLYQQNGANPAAGCLPILIQMPVLIVLWRVFANFEFDQGFLWLRDLALPDQYFILPVLYTVVNIAQTYYYTKNNPEMFKQQLMFQVIFVYLTLQFPSGVTLYYVLSTMIQVTQQYLINRSLGVKPGGPMAPTKTVTVQANKK
jgi:YidC/Oxa1 family membrane protein insertase